MSPLKETNLHLHRFPKIPGLRLTLAVSQADDILSFGRSPLLQIPACCLSQANLHSSAMSGRLTIFHINKKAACLLTDSRFEADSNAAFKYPSPLPRGGKLIQLHPKGHLSQRSRPCTGSECCKQEVRHICGYLEPTGLMERLTLA